jgi:hypothetical protein
MKNYVFILGTVFSLSSQACLHMATQVDPRLLKQTETEVFLYHDGKNAHRVLRTAFEGKVPAEITWVLPFPSKPVSYTESSSELFVEAHALFKDLYASGGGTMQKSANSMQRTMPSTIRVHEQKVVGNYEITPLEILRSDDGKDLNAWLTKHGFNTMPDALQKPYLFKGAYFLAVRIKTGAEPSRMKPLDVAYPSKTLDFPARFTHAGREYDLSLYVVSELSGEKMQARASELVRNSYAERSSTLDLPASLGEKRLGLAKNIKPRTITQVIFRGLNSASKPLAKLTADPSFEAK